MTTWPRPRPSPTEDMKNVFNIKNKKPSWKEGRKEGREKEVEGREKEVEEIETTQENFQKN